MKQLCWPQVDQISDKDPEMSLSDTEKELMEVDDRNSGDGEYCNPICL